MSVETLDDVAMLDDIGPEHVKPPLGWELFSYLMLHVQLRDRLNHPSSIKRRYELTPGFGIGALGEGAKLLSPAAKKDAEIARLQGGAGCRQCENPAAGARRRRHAADQPQ